MFAPSNAAMDAVPQSKIDALSKDYTNLRSKCASISLIHEKAKTFVSSLHFDILCKEVSRIRSGIHQSFSSKFFLSFSWLSRNV